jgi:hypothetical protein
MKFINPTNNYELTDGSALSWLWFMLIGPLYFAIRGNWSWFFISALLIVGTLGIAYLVIPFFVRKINRTHLYRKGFKCS